MKTILLAAALLSSAAFAEDGLVVHFTIKKTAGNTTTTYTNGVLMRTTESSTFTFPGQYGLRLESRAMGKGEVNLVATLDDLSSGKPMYAGSNAITLKIGASANVALHQIDAAETKYEILLDTAYGQLPQAATTP
jgi:hypothetical protein